MVGRFFVLIDKLSKIPIFITENRRITKVQSLNCLELDLIIAYVLKGKSLTLRRLVEPLSTTTHFKLEEISAKLLLIRHPCPPVKCFACFSSLNHVAVCLNLDGLMKNLSSSRN